MNKIDSTWEQRVADLWKGFDDYEPDAFVAQIDALALELPPHNAVGLFDAPRRCLRPVLRVAG